MLPEIYDTVQEEAQNAVIITEFQMYYKAPAWGIFIKIGK